MRDSTAQQRATLIAGAISGDLTDTELTALQALRLVDPTVDDEIRELAAVSSRTAASLTGWDSSAPSAGLRQRILAAAATDQAPAPAHTAPARVAEPSTAAPTPARRRPWLLALAAAACVGVGAGGVLLSQPVTPGAPTGPPGTLGAVEQIAFTGEPDGVTVAGSLIAHTWGTETVLTIVGLTETIPYDVVLVTTAGDTIDSGSFLGSTVTIDCGMNAAVMRGAVSSVQIQDASGAVVATADVPETS